MRRSVGFTTTELARQPPERSSASFPIAPAAEARRRSHAAALRRRMRQDAMAVAATTSTRPRSRDSCGPRATTWSTRRRRPPLLLYPTPRMVDLLLLRRHRRRRSSPRPRSSPATAGFDSRPARTRPVDCSPPPPIPLSPASPPHRLAHGAVCRSPRSGKREERER